MDVVTGGSPCQDLSVAGKRAGLAGEQAVYAHGWNCAIEIIEKAPAVDAVEVSADELKYLINDTIAYIWRMEDSGRDKSEFGYDERKALLEKLKRFKKEHFPEMRCCAERREENG